MTCTEHLIPTASLNLNPLPCLNLPNHLVLRLRHVARLIEAEVPSFFRRFLFLVEPVAKAAFHDPDVLQLPPDMWPRLAKALVHSSKSELLKLAKVWDRAGALRIFRENETGDCVGLFTTPKDESFDKLILNPVVVNSRTRTLNTYTRFLSHGSQFCRTSWPGSAQTIFANSIIP